MGGGSELSMNIHKGKVYKLKWSIIHLLARWKMHQVMDDGRQTVKITGHLAATIRTVDSIN